MMDPGNWNTHKSLFNGFTNPIYIPQLLFRTPVAMLMGGVFGMLLTTLFTQKGSQLREQLVRLGGKWILGWTPLALVGAIYYWHAMPDTMKANMSTAVGSMDFSEYYDILKYFIVGSTSLSILLAVWAILKPKKVNFAVVLIPCLFVFGFLGIFERVREFIRKPYVIGGYM